MVHLQECWSASVEHFEDCDVPVSELSMLLFGGLSKHLVQRASHDLCHISQASVSCFQCSTHLKLVGW